MSKNKLDWNRISEGIDPVTWLINNTGWQPFPYEAEILRDNVLRLRVIKKSRQIGITTTVAHEAIWKVFTMPNRMILIVSPSDRQSKIVMSRIQAVVNLNPRLYERVTAKNTSELQLDNRSAILSLPNNPDRLRGFSATDIYLDEAAHFLNDGPVMAAIKPMLIATKGTFTVVSTPFGKRGIFYEQYQLVTNQQGADPTMKAYDLHPSIINPLISATDLEAENQNLTELEFKQEYLGEFIEQTDTYYPLGLVQPCVDPELALLDHGEEGHRYMMGVDFGKQRDETVVILVEKFPDGIFIVRHISAWSKMDYSEQTGRIAQLATRFKIENARADQTGVGEAVIENLKHALPVVEGVTFSQKTKLDMAGGLRTLFEKKQIRIPNDRKLILQLTSLRYQVSKTGNLLFDSPEKEHLHDDYLWALALACCSPSYPPLGYITLDEIIKRPRITGRLVDPPHWLVGSGV